MDNIVLLVFDIIILISTLSGLAIAYYKSKQPGDEQGIDWKVKHQRELHELWDVVVHNKLVYRIHEHTGQIDALKKKLWKTYELQKRVHQIMNPECYKDPPLSKAIRRKPSPRPLSIEDQSFETVPERLYTPSPRHIAASSQSSADTGTLEV